MLMHILCICRVQADARVSSEIGRVFMNIQSSHEVEHCPEGNEVEWGKVFMIRAQELRKDTGGLHQIL